MAGLLNYTKGYQGGGLYIPTSTRVRGQYGYLDRLFTEDIREKGEEAKEQMAGLKAKGAIGSLGGKLLGSFIGRKILTSVLGGGLKTALTSSVARTALLSNPWAIAAAVAAPTVLSYLGKMAPLGLKKNPLTGKAYDRPEDIEKGFKVDGRTSKFRQSEYADIAEAMSQQRKTAKELALAEAPGEAIGAAKGYATAALTGASWDKASEYFGGGEELLSVTGEEPKLLGETVSTKEGASNILAGRPEGTPLSAEQLRTMEESAMSSLYPETGQAVDPFVETGPRAWVDPNDMTVMQTFPGATQSAGYGEGTRSQYRTLGDIDSNLIDPSAKIDPLMVPPAEDPFKKAALEYYRSPEGLEELGLTPPAQTVTERLADVGSAMYQRGPNYMQATTDVLGQLDVPAPDVLEGFRQGTGSPYNQFLGATGQYNPFGQQFAPRRQQRLMPSLLDYLGGGTGY